MGEKGRYKAALRRAKLKARARKKEGSSETVGGTAGVGLPEVSAEKYGDNPPQDGEGSRANEATAGGLGNSEVGRGVEGLQVGGSEERAHSSGESEADAESGSEGEASVAPSTIGERHTLL